MQTAILYCRVSTNEQGDSRNGLEAQHSALMKYCKDQGIEPILHLEEVVSGGLWVESRPMLAKALSWCHKHKAMLLVAKLDRLSRSVQHISTLMNSGLMFQSAEDGPEADPMLLHFKAVIGEHERKLISKRTRAALEAKKARGEALGCRAHKDPSRWASIQPLGQKVAVDRANTFALEKYPLLLSLHKSGQTQIQIAETLNRQGVKTFTGRGRWHQSTVGDLMLRAERLTWRN